MAEEEPRFRFTLPDPVKALHPHVSGLQYMHNQWSTLMHTHIIDERWTPEQKNEAGNHIDAWHNRKFSR